MAFGFSVGDFVMLAEKAFQIYNQFKDAPSDYDNLKRHVQQLSAATEDTAAWLVKAEKDEEIPQSRLRLNSLKSMHGVCNCTLDEVVDFLHNHINVKAAHGALKYIAKLRFISDDAEKLAKKLQSDTSLLNLRLSSIQCLSVMEIKTGLKVLTEEYRRGKREPSVISRAITDHQPAEKAEMFEQISQDLLDKEVHPECINLNKPYLDEWLSKVIEEGGLDEEDPPTSQQLEVPPTTTIKVMNPSAEPLTSSPIDMNAAEHSGCSPTSPETQPAMVDDAKIAPTFPNDNKEPYEDLEKEPVVLDDSITVRNGGSVREEPRPRSNSTTSSASKPDDWHPYDRPEPTYVRNKLQPLLIAEPTPDPLSADSMHAVMRAFHQADYRDEGFLTRHTVLLHLRDVLKDAPWITYSDDFESMVLRFDVNHDGYFGKNEFLSLIQNLMRYTSQARETRIANDFAAVVGQARADWVDRRAAAPLPFLHWGFAKAPGGKEGYFDTILQNPVKDAPYDTCLSAFSHLAWEAKECVSRISDFETEWIGKVPKTLQDEYLVPLRRVQRVAIAFTLLENKSSPHERSDLDKFLDCSRLSAYLHDVTDDPEIDRTSSLLVAAKGICKIILDNVLGFTFTLKSAEKLRTSNYNNFGEFKSWWDRNRMTWRSNKIVIESAKWNVVEDAVNQYSKAGINKLVVIRAHKFITIFRRREIEKAMRRKQRFTEETPWEGHIEQAAISGLNQNWISKTIGPSKIFLKISIYDDQTLYHANREMFTIPQKRAAEHSWRLGPESNIRLLPASCVEVSVLTLDLKRPGGRADGTLMYRSGAITISRLNFMARTADVGVRRITGTLYPVQGSFSDIDYEKKSACAFDIEIHMKDSPEFMERINSLEAKDWRPLLLEDLPGDTDPKEYHVYTDPEEYHMYIDAYRDKVLKKRIDSVGNGT